MNQMDLVLPKDITSPTSSGSTSDGSTSIGSTSMRTHLCAQVSTSDVDTRVRLCGWVSSRREHGEHLAFIDLRDYTGIIQCVVDGTLDVRSEYVLAVEGVVRLRPVGTQNNDLATGQVEIGDCKVEVLGISKEQVQSRFGFLLDAFRFGAPPHAGFAFGIDRLVAIFCGEENIREVIAFPKTQSGSDLLTGAPKQLSEVTLRELGVRVVPNPHP